MSEQDQLTNRTETVVQRIRTQLEELAPAINAFQSEAVQLRLVDGFVLPQLLATVEASNEYVIALSARLLNGDTQKNIAMMQLILEALEDQKASLREIMLMTSLRDKIIHKDEDD